MNFLAHAGLSGSNKLVLVGNFVADAVKGNMLQSFPEEMQKGILLHRFIDQYTDAHETVQLTKNILRPEFRHYAPVIADVFYDHFLARFWSEYFPGISFENFISSTYKTILEHFSILPERSQQMIPYMISQDWLGSYITIDGISDVLKRMSRRTKFESGMENAGIALRKNYDAYETHFRNFFPDLKKESERILVKLLNKNG